MRLWWHVLALLFILALTLPARAGDGHGWAIVADDAKASSRETVPRFIVLHIPPTSPGSRQGVVRAAQWLLKEPERLCWQGNRVYLVMPSETIVADTRREIRRVLSMQTDYSIAGVWTYLPSDGPELLPSLPGEGELVGFVGTSAGPVALLHIVQSERKSGSADSDAGVLSTNEKPRDTPRDSPPASTPTTSPPPTPQQHTWRLLLLDGRDWIDLALPWQPLAANPAATTAPDNARVHLVPTKDGVGLFIRPAKSSTASWWTARVALPVTAATFSSPPSLAWTMETYSLRMKVAGGAEAEGANQPLAINSIFGVDGLPVAITYHDSVITAYLLLKEGPVQIARKQGVTPGYRIVPRSGSSGDRGSSGGGGAGGAGGSGVLSILWPDPTPPDTDQAKAKRRQPRVFNLYEFFATGRVLYDGPARQDGPLSIREVELISVILGGILIAVIIFVLKPEQRPNDRVLKLLPRGFVMAGTARRAIASVLDLTIGIVAARALLGLNWNHVLDPGLISSQQGGLMLLAAGFVLTWLHATIMEWLLGTTFGKLLVDCRVISLRVPPSTSTPSPADTAPASSTSDQVSPTLPSAAANEARRFKITLWQAAIRNLLKWIPPLSLAVFIGPRPRHFADQAAGTVVVEPEVRERPADE